MKHTKTVTALATMALASALILGACGTGKTASQSAPSSSPKVSQSSAKASSSVTKKIQESSSASVSTVTSAATETEESSIVTTPASTEVATPASATVAQASTSDFAHLVGSWSNDQGWTITINPDGSFADGGKIESYGNGALGYRSKEGFGAVVHYAPAGQEFPESIAPKEYTEGTDISRERLVISQSVNEMVHPYYRVK